MIEQTEDIKEHSEVSSQSNSSMVIDISELKVIEREISKDHYVIEFANKREPDFPLVQNVNDEIQNLTVNEKKISSSTSKNKYLPVLILTIILLIFIVLLIYLKFFKFENFLKK